jgi:hypothetical protein
VGAISRKRSTWEERAISAQAAKNEEFRFVR